MAKPQVTTSSPSRAPSAPAPRDAREAGLLDWLRREARFATMAYRTLRRLRPLRPDAAITGADLIEATAARFPTHEALFFEGRALTYDALDRAANRVARWALATGIKRGDVVALMMENRPEYIIVWFGLLKIGAVAALINTSLTERPLAHCLTVAGADHLILGSELAGAFASAAGLLDRPMRVWALGGDVQDTDSLDVALLDHSGDALPRHVREGLVAGDPAFLIFTSGTTGLPKAARITHLRMQSLMHAFASATNAGPRDRVYDVLPLYHTAGGICAIGIAFCVGGAVVLRRRFSASQFWADVHAQGVTIFQYIGELCRYLLSAPEHPLERSHALRCIVGNGLRPDIWGAFEERFQIPRILEFYGATEGNVSLMNIDGRIGAVGRVPHWARAMLQVRIVKFDIESETPIRDPASGLCIECAAGEPGEMIGRITEDPRTRFDGYTKASDTERKILRDVFEPGDAWFRTGDLMRQDDDGYVYFVDRIGDTFRWKGENVATSEVAEAATRFPAIREANVYGVAVPAHEGKAGMAAIVVAGPCDFGALYRHFEGALPAYARPLFLRLTQAMETTGTFKHRKIELVREGFDPARAGEPLFYRDDAARTYRPLDAEAHARILAGAITP